MPAHELPEQPFAVALAVGKGGIEEVAAEFDRQVQRRSDSPLSEPVQPPMPHMP